MKLVVTNDDGYDEPGLATLLNALAPMGDVMMAAPRHPQSSCGHWVTLREPIHVEQISDIAYIVDGSPADCTRLALKGFATDADWVIAGINPGANLGSDLYQSGTVAAAREAAILGCKAISISQYIAPDQKIDWEITGRHVSKMLSIIMKQPLKKGQFWNINMPHPLESASFPEFEYCEPDKNPHIYLYQKNSGHYLYTGVIHNRPRAAGSDVDVCFGGKISISLLEI